MDYREIKTQQAVACSDEDYEKTASQEQEYLDNVEENLRVILEELPGHLAEKPTACSPGTPPFSEEMIFRMYRWLGMI